MGFGMGFGIWDGIWDWDGNGIWDLGWRSEEHTSELQSRSDLVCRLLLEKKKKKHADSILHQALTTTLNRIRIRPSAHTHSPPHPREPPQLRLGTRRHGLRRSYPDRSMLR